MTGPEILRLLTRPKWAWTVCWMRFAGTGRFGRFASRMATAAAPPYKARRYLAGLHPQGYIAPDAELHQVDLRRGAHTFIGERVVVYNGGDGGPIELGDGAHLHRETIVELGAGGAIELGADTHLQPHCLLAAYAGTIRIGAHVQIGAGCRFYPYDHGFAADRRIMEQPLKTQGGIVIEDDVWLGAGVTVLDGAYVGAGAVIGAGAVVKGAVPPGAIAAGVPARVLRMRGEEQKKG